MGTQTLFVQDEVKSIIISRVTNVLRQVPLVPEERNNCTVLLHTAITVLCAVQITWLLLPLSATVQYYRVPLSITLYLCDVPTILPPTTLPPTYLPSWKCSFVHSTAQYVQHKHCTGTKQAGGRVRVTFHGG